MSREKMRITCPACGKTALVPKADGLSIRVKCTRCKTRFTITDPWPAVDQARRDFELGKDEDDGSLIW